MATSRRGAGRQRLLSRHAPAGRAVRTPDRARMSCGHDHRRASSAPHDLDAARGRCWPATRSATASSPPGCDALGLRLVARSAASSGATVAAGSLPALCYAGANLVPVEAHRRRPRAAFADRARRQGRRCSSIVGPADAVAAAVGAARAGLGPGPRRPRRASRCMVIDGPPAACRPTRWCAGAHLHELDLLMPACVAMFTEEVGVSPAGGDGGARYRARVAELVRRGRAFAPDRGRPRSSSRPRSARSPAAACQVQGVWVAPEPPRPGARRAGHGRGRASTRAARRAAGQPVRQRLQHRRRAPRTTRVGFREVGSFATVLF